MPPQEMRDRSLPSPGPEAPLVAFSMTGSLPLLILLAKAGNLDLLRAGVPEILVPDAVLSEVAARGPTDLVLQRIKITAWLR
jgi:hypothetical protein